MCERWQALAARSPRFLFVASRRQSRFSETGSDSLRYTSTTASRSCSATTLASTFGKPPTEAGQNERTCTSGPSTRAPNPSFSIRQLAVPANASERRAIRNNARDQKGWLVLSPRAEQILADTGHAVEEEDPELVIDAILAAVKDAR
jgi:hypothetical protein